jgi:hypothetical protein
MFGSNAPPMMRAPVKLCQGTSSLASSPSCRQDSKTPSMITRVDNPLPSFPAPRCPGNVSRHLSDLTPERLTTQPEESTPGVGILRIGN